MYFINESLESLQESVSESTYNEIMYMVEEIISEVSKEWKENAMDKISKPEREAWDKMKDFRKKMPYLEGPVNQKHEELREIWSELAGRKHKLEKAIEKHNKAKEEGRIKPADGKQYKD